MPTYQYACTACGHAFEIVQSFSDEALQHCPVCDGRLRKVFSAVGVVFKGSGFYRTDSRAPAAEKGTASGAEKKPDSSGAEKKAPAGADSSSGSSGSPKKDSAPSPS